MIKYRLMLLIPTTVGKFLLLRHLEMVFLFKQEILTHTPRRGMVHDLLLKSGICIIYFAVKTECLSVICLQVTCVSSAGLEKLIAISLVCSFFWVFWKFYRIVRMFNFGIDESNWFQHSSTPKTILCPLFHSSLVDLPIERTLFELVCPIPGRASCYRYPR